MASGADSGAAGQKAKIDKLVEKLEGPVSFDTIVARVGAATVKERLTTDQHVLVNSRGAHWKWQDAGLTSRITATLDENRRKRSEARLSERGLWDKQNMTQVMLASGPGTGKSKALMELGKRFSQIRDGRTRIVLAVSFENGTRLTRREFDCERALVNRVYHHLLFGNETSAGSSGWMSFQDWMEETGGAAKEWMLDAVAKLYECDSVECILLIDGVHNLGGGYAANGAPSSKVKDLMRLLCNIVLGGDMHHVFPVCAMSSYPAAFEALARTLETRQAYFGAPLLQRLPDGLPAGAEQYFWMTDGHGGALEAVASVLERAEGRETATGDTELLREICDELREKYATSLPTTKEEIDDVLRAAVDRTPAACGDLRERALMTLEPFRADGALTATLYTAPTFAWVLLHAGVPGTLLSGLDFTSGKGWESFEEFVAWYRVLLSRVADKQKIGSFQEIRWFHKGAEWLRSPGYELMRSRTPASYPELHRCANQEATKVWKDQIETTELATPAVTETLGATFLNAEKASGADVFTTVDYTNGYKAYETIRCKHASVGSDEGTAGSAAVQPQDLTADEMMTEIDKCAHPGGVFLFLSNRPWKETAERVKEFEASCRQYRCAVGLVHEGNFRDYFLPTFAPMWQQRNPQPSSQTGVLVACDGVITRIATHTASLPTHSALRSWTPPRWDTTRAAAVQPSWLPPRVAAAAPRNAVNLLLLRRATKVFL